MRTQKRRSEAEAPGARARPRGDAGREALVVRARQEKGEAGAEGLGVGAQQRRGEAEANAPGVRERPTGSEAGGEAPEGSPTRRRAGRVGSA